MASTQEMVNVQAYFASALSLLPLSYHQHAKPQPSKSIAIVGGGSAGLAMLKALLDLPEQMRGNWDIVLYEQRRDIGGVWLPDSNPPAPPEVPGTPLYPLLHTTTPVPSMTYKNFPFPPMTPLYPSHEHIEQYFRDYADHFKLWPYIKFQHEVVGAVWTGTSEDGFWDVTVKETDGQEVRRVVNHLIVATGNNNHYPHVATFTGQDEWLERDSEREILHTAWYRGPEKYADKTVIVVGGMASGIDMAKQIVPVARKVYHSVRSNPQPVEGAIVKPEISRFTDDTVHFRDGSTVRGVDSVLLGTGYDLRVPFLERSGVVQVEPFERPKPKHRRRLVNNLRYLFPLHRHVLSLCPSHPPNALAFVGLVLKVSYCPADVAQSLFVAHAIANPDILPSRKELLDELQRHEADLEKHGLDPYWLGHRLVDGTEFEYQNELVEYLKTKGAIPDDGEVFVEDWRREAKAMGYPQMKRGWERIEDMGAAEEWLHGVETEEQWAGLMRRVHEWQKDWEESARTTS